jgi:hypothetical protein
MKAELYVLFAVGTLCSAQPVPLKLYENTLNNWQAKTGVRIDSGAKQKIMADAQAAQPKIRDSFAVGHLQQYSTVTQQLVRQYCFDQRDRKLPNSKSEPMKITKDDVSHWSFLDFLAEFIGGQPRQKVGYLEVQAGRPAAEILIDSERKGYTNRSLVMSVGTYTIDIRHPQLSCGAHEITIRDGATETVKCPQ